MNIRKKHQTEIRYFYPDVHSSRLASLFFRCLLVRQMPPDATAILLCIGTDRITGDCLGPMTGTRLQDASCPFPVFGTLQHPVHAINLPAVLHKLQHSFRNPFFIVVDAAVGAENTVGSVAISPTAILPGAGISRPLLPVGDISITGIIGEKNTGDISCIRLFLVDRLARYIEEVLLL